MTEKITLEKLRLQVQITLNSMLKDYQNLDIVFEKFHSDTVFNLFLKSNNIEDVTALIKISLPGLTSLWLGDNKILNLKPLLFLPFPKLRRLYLNSNNIHSIKQLVNFNFQWLSQLDLDNNKISDIEPLAKMNVPSLSILDLNRNYIHNIEPITKMNRSKLHIQINCKSISNYKPLLKFHKDISSEFGRSNYYQSTFCTRFSNRKD